MKERLKGPLLKLSRANKHIHELEGYETAYAASHPYVIEVKKNTDGKPVYYVSDVVVPSREAATMTGDVLQNLRSALDHVVWQLVESNGQQPKRHNQFPISRDKVKYGPNSLISLDGIGPGAKKLIDDCEPYRGGNDLLWRLGHFNNVDKHRLLLTVGAMPTTLNIGKIISKDFSRSFGKEVSIDLNVGFGLDDLIPLRVNHEIYIDAKNAPMDKEIQFSVGLILDEAESEKGKSLLHNLKAMSKEVDRILQSLEPFL